MSARNPPKHISCTRCQSKKIRCNRVEPRCDKCEAIGAKCTYLPRKARSKKSSGVDDKHVLREMLRRLERLEDHCRLNTDTENGDASRSMSISSADSGWNDPELPVAPSSVYKGQPPTPNTQGVVQGILNRIKDEKTKVLLTSNIFCHLRNVQSRLFDNESCIEAIEAAMVEISHIEESRLDDTSDPPEIPKELARRFVHSYFDVYQFEGFRIPLERNFLLSIPDLLEIPHVQLDATSRLIYYNVMLQGVLIDPDHDPRRGGIVQSLYRSCMTLVDPWLEQDGQTPADLFVAFLMISMTLEGCNSELSWKILGKACRISRTLGYFSVDGDPGELNGEHPPARESNPNESEVDRNRKRFEFWHLLRTDCLFRLSFGKPTLIPEGTWAVNLPDPTITGNDDASTRFIQIHFLASMRLALVVLKYLNWADAQPDEESDEHDEWLDSLIAEVQTIMSDWNAEELVSTTENNVDTLFCVDILFSSYKMLIVFSQAKKCNRDSPHLPRHTVDVARKALKMFRSLMVGSVQTYWGISLMILHQFVPFFVLCTDIIDCREPDKIEDDLVLTSWVNEFVEKAGEDRTELRPITIITNAMMAACQQVYVGSR
ncbi:hypothetical protein BDV25DRAFT_147465 [Aspergillus avenaceus]|uniref:Zn(2)-C6 fungal-type domain-containing protein n=1 Tax=Aspergillus avenaceus TaxID=36643 RepID=A0A5N6U8U8_ASPAV|nr:hypothetical protein BDV25DRAFT_147465 [Aspergillus avenaceus]